MDSRDKRDLPEVMAEILMEQHAMRQDIAGLREEIGGLRQEIRADNTALRQEMRADNVALRQEMQESSTTLRQELQKSLEGLVQLFNGMTNSILNAMNRGTDRYNSTADEVDKLNGRVTKLESPAAGVA